jgi:hypothetical protein
MKSAILIASVVMTGLSAPVIGSVTTLSPADEAAAYKSAGFEFKDGQWRACDDPSLSYTPGKIEETDDFNGDGLPDALISEGGTFCYGMTGAGYYLVSKQADGGWKLMTSGTGILSFLDSKGRDGWPDIEISGPGFCFPVASWNGKEYALKGHQYEGKPCRP